MRVLCCQPDVVWENKSANHLRIEKMIAEAQPSSGSLIVLPEMFATGFSNNSAVCAEDESGATHSFLSELAARHKCYVLAGIVVTGGAERPTNQAVLFDPTGGIQARYAKQRLFTLAQEDCHYVPGKSTVVTKIEDFSIAPLICYDLRFPELFRHATCAGAQIIVVIASWPRKRMSHWQALLKARAIENQAYVVAVNRTGVDPNFEYAGGSCIIDFNGDTLVEAGSEPCLIDADLDVAALQKHRLDFPFLHFDKSELDSPTSSSR